MTSTKNQNQTPLTVTEAAAHLGLTPDELRSGIWAGNFPQLAVQEWGDAMRIILGTAGQVLADENVLHVTCP